MTTVDSLVTTADGVVAGARGKRTRRGSISWRGIPFAAPPVGRNRFADPQPVQPWPGVRDCTRYGKAGIQEKRFTAVAPGKFAPMGEDCLTLNVFAPDTPSATPRPVMVFIHGGAYILGTTATPLYDGSLLARDQNLIVVTVQYRFGAFGYLDLRDYSTEDRPLGVNLGVRDHLAALQWVQRNIAAFGGDPDNVTLFGESAGASAVTTLLSTPSAAGLFVRAIAESPACELVIDQDNARIYADEFLRQLRDPSRRATSLERTEEPMAPEEAQQLLLSASAHDILAAGNRLMKFAQHSDSGDPVPFGPIVDGTLLPASPLVTAARGETMPVPLIIGTNRDEGQLFAKMWNILPDAERTLLRVDDDQIRKDLVALYDGGGRDRLQLVGDSVFWAPMAAFAEGHAAVAPTFVYRYDFRTRVLGWTGLGATHATELFAVFGAFRAPIGAGLAIADWAATSRVTDDVQSRWARFARTGRPGADWPAYTVDDRSVLIIDDPDRVETDPDGARRTAWRRVHTVS